MNKSFEVGDSVSFLDQKLDGVIISMEPNGSLLIETTDGFEITAKPHELVLKSIALKETKEEDVLISKTTPSPLSELSVRKFADNDHLSLLIHAYEPNKVLTGMVRLMLVNNTSYGIYYTLNQNSKQGTEIVHGDLKATTEKMLIEYSRENWFGKQDLNLHAMFYNTDSGPILIKRNLKIQLPGLTEIVTSIDGDQIFATVIPIYSAHKNETPDFEKLIDKFKPEESLVNTKSKKRNFTIAGSGDQVFPKENVIDLHIEELVSDLSGLDPKTMLEIQLNAFNRALNKAIQERHYNIIFIHGVGKKILKNAIINELGKYPGLRWHDADPLRYGSGATEVLVNAPV